MSFKQVTKDLSNASKVYVKSAVKDFKNQFNDLAMRLSERYIGPYIPIPEGGGIISPLDHIGSCMRAALRPLRYYSNVNPYAYVDIENFERFRDGLSQDGSVPMTNDVMRFGVENELGEMHDVFETQN